MPPPADRLIAVRSLSASTGSNCGANLNIIRVALDEFRFQQAQPLRQQHQLLTNDSLLAAAAFQYGIANVATNDSDFQRVPWLTVYKPGDIP